MWFAIVAIIAILAWALTRIIQSGSQSGAEWAKVAQSGAEWTKQGDDPNALTKRVDALEDERAQLLERLANLEAIVTSETYELDRTTAHLGTELPEAGGRPPLALDEPLDADEAEQEVARQARRLRER